MLRDTMVRRCIDAMTGTEKKMLEQKDVKTAGAEEEYKRLQKNFSDHYLLSRFLLNVCQSCTRDREVLDVITDWHLSLVSQGLFHKLAKMIPTGVWDGNKGHPFLTCSRFHYANSVSTTQDWLDFHAAFHEFSRPREGTIARAHVERCRAVAILKSSDPGGFYEGSYSWRCLHSATRAIGMVHGHRQWELIADLYHPCSLELHRLGVAQAWAMYQRAVQCGYSWLTSLREDVGGFADDLRCLKANSFVLELCTDGLSAFGDKAAEFHRKFDPNITLAA